MRSDESNGICGSVTRANHALRTHVDAKVKRIYVSSRYKRTAMHESTEKLQICPDILRPT